jgi:hypothetical protein
LEKLRKNIQKLILGKEWCQKHCVLLFKSDVAQNTFFGQSLQHQKNGGRPQRFAFMLIVLELGWRSAAPKL